MRKHLNTLYVTTENSWVRKDGLNIVISVKKEVKGRVPIHMIGSIVCFGRVAVSPPLMGFCSERGVTIVFLTDYGKFLARVEGPVSGNVLLRREQYRRTDDAVGCGEIVRNLVAGKVHNQRSVLRRVLRDYADPDESDSNRALQKADKQLSRVLETIKSELDVDKLRGFEGDAGQIYFSVFPLFLRGADYFQFKGRSRRPPLDSVNATLSFVYTLLVNDCRSALETVGLDPAVGFLHRDRPGRPSLALDLIEEFRAPYADRLVLSLINRRQLSDKDFDNMDNGAVLLNENGRNTVITAWQERKQKELSHAFIGENVTVGMLWHVQAMLLARHLRGDLDAYPPCLHK